MPNRNISAAYKIIRPTTEEEPSCTVILEVAGLSDNNDEIEIHVQLPAEARFLPDHELLDRSVQDSIRRLSSLANYL